MPVSSQRSDSVEQVPVSVVSRQGAIATQTELDLSIPPLPSRQAYDDFKARIPATAAGALFKFRKK